MTNKHYRYHSIKQFREVYKQVQKDTAFVGFGDNGDPIEDWHKPLPILTFTGSEKLHGTNAAIGINSDGTFWVQSRERIITPESDNAGFAQWVYGNTALVVSLYNRLFDAYLKSSDVKVIVYGEWCGANIQPQVALSKLPKMFVVFDIKWVVGDEEGWVGHEEIKGAMAGLLHTVYDFPTYSITIDFDNPDDSVNELIRITDKIESCSPLAKELGALGIGEGAVWKCGYYIFKVKGKLHSASHTKQLVGIDVERVATIKECVDRIVSENRLKQGVDELIANGIAIDNKAIKPFIDWVKNDCIKEEMDVIVESGLEVKDTIKFISDRAKTYFIEEVLRKLDDKSKFI
jgi:hypothetical protein